MTKTFKTSKLFVLLVSVLLVFTAFMAEAKIVKFGKYIHKRPDGTVCTIEFQWHVSDDNSGFVLTTWTESDRPGEEFANAGHFFPPYNGKSGELTNHNQINVIPSSEHTVFPYEIIEELEPVYGTEVTASNGILGLRIYEKMPQGNPELIKAIPASVSLYEVSTGKAIFENEPIRIGDEMNYFKLNDKVSENLQYYVTFKIKNVVNNDVVFFFTTDGSKLQK